MSSSPSTASIVALGFAEELIASPAMLEAYGRAVGPNDGVTLLVYAPDAEPAELERRLWPAVVAAGLDGEDSAEIVGLALPADEDTTAALAEQATCVFTDASVDGTPFRSLPVVRSANVAGLGRRAAQPPPAEVPDASPSASPGPSPSPGLLFRYALALRVAAGAGVLDAGAPAWARALLPPSAPDGTAGVAVLLDGLDRLTDRRAALESLWRSAATVMVGFPNPALDRSQPDRYHVNDWTLDVLERELADAAAERFASVELRHFAQGADGLIAEGRDPGAAGWIVVATGTAGAAPAARLEIGELLLRAAPFAAELDAVKASDSTGVAWYPYGSLSNLVHLDGLLTGANRDLRSLVGALPVADVGAADGDLAFLLERELGCDVDIVDFGPTNYNNLRGARRLRELLGSGVAIHEIDLDRSFALPRDAYGLVLLLGILYHLQNPFSILRGLAERARQCLLSTRIAQVTADGSTRFDAQPMAYLVAPDETNNDPTNYWIFSDAGLRRLIDRTGWDVLDYRRVGCLADSDPAAGDRDERAFALLRSRVFAGR